MSNFFAQLTGYDSKYSEMYSGKKIDDTIEDTDYSEVDFCQGDIPYNGQDGGIFDSKCDSELDFFEEDEGWEG